MRVASLGQNEDCSPDDGTSDSSERLLQRGEGKRSIYMIFGEGGIHAVKHCLTIFLQEVFASHEKQMSP